VLCVILCSCACGTNVSSLLQQAPWRLLRQPRPATKINEPAELIAPRTGSGQTSSEVPAEPVFAAQEPIQLSPSEEQSSPPIKPPAAKHPRKGSKGMCTTYLCTRTTHSCEIAHKTADRKGKAHENAPSGPVEEFEVDLEPEIEEMNLESMAIDEGGSQFSALMVD
jgi:hypothetical protein